MAGIWGQSAREKRAKPVLIAQPIQAVALSADVSTVVGQAK
jgi:hypothetical protein